MSVCVYVTKVAIVKYSQTVRVFIFLNKIKLVAMLLRKLNAKKCLKVHKKYVTNGMFGAFISTHQEIQCFKFAGLKKKKYWIFQIFLKVKQSQVINAKKGKC